MISRPSKVILRHTKVSNIHIYFITLLLFISAYIQTVIYYYRYYSYKPHVIRGASIAMYWAKFRIPCYVFCVTMQNFRKPKNPSNILPDPRTECDSLPGNRTCDHSINEADTNVNASTIQVKILVLGKS